MKGYKAKLWVGVDPGQTGAMAALVDDGGHLAPTATYKMWEGTRSMYHTLVTWSTFYHIVAVAVEKQHAMARDSKQSATTFQQHYGEWKALIKIAGFEPVEVRPAAWMKRRIAAKKGPGDKPSVPYVQKRYPYINMAGPRGGIRDGIADAICIAEWCREVHRS